MKKFLITILIIFLIFLGISVSTLTYYGFMPGLSKVFGTSVAKDLNVAVTVDKGTESSKKMKLPQNIEDLKNLIKNPSAYKEVKTSLNSEEISSLLQISQNKDFPFCLVQIRINADNSVEASGYATPEKVANYLAKTGVTSNVVKEVFKYLQFSNYVPVYAKATGTITNNKFDLNIQSFAVGKISVPQDKINTYTNDVENYLTNVCNKNQVYVKKLDISNKQANVDMNRSLQSMEPWLPLAQKNK